MQVRLQKILVIALLCAAFFCGCPWRMFCHANIFHLLANVVCLWQVYNDRVLPWWMVFPITITAGALCMTSTAVGFSSALFVMMGINMCASMDKRTMAVMAAFFIVTWFIPSLAWLTHFSAFLCGMAIGYMALWIRNYAKY